MITPTRTGTMPLHAADTFGKRVRYYRLLRHLTTARLGALLGVPRQVITLWETEVTLPGAARIQRLAQVLDVTPGDFFPQGWTPTQRKHRTRRERREPTTPQERAAAATEALLKTLTTQKG